MDSYDDISSVGHAHVIYRGVVAAYLITDVNRLVTHLTQSGQKYLFREFATLIPETPRRAPSSRVSGIRYAHSRNS